MAAPVPGLRGTPTGVAMGDGYSTKIDFAADSTISFWEKTVQPPGMDGGDAVETTTMHNTTYRTMRPRNLITMTEGSITAAYDPDLYTSIVSLINVETTVTVNFPDGRSVAFYGYLKSFEPSDNTEGEQPECEITIQPTNWDATNSVEAGPVVGTAS